MTVTVPIQMNEAFARAFNSRNIEKLLALYEPDAVLRIDGGEKSFAGITAIATELTNLLSTSGTMISQNNFCIQQGNLALLRADWTLTGGDGAIIAAGSSVELARQQADGSWLYVIDHAAGAGLPRVS